MPEPKGRRNRRDRERERRRTREPGAPLSEEERMERDMRQVLPQPRASRAQQSNVRQPVGPVELPNMRVRITGAMVGLLTLLGAMYMITSAALNGGGVDSYVTIVGGTLFLGVGLFAGALSLFPGQISRWVRRDR